MATLRVPTKSDIKELRRAFEWLGDGDKWVAVCDRALKGDKAALAECAEIIAEGGGR